MGASHDCFVKTVAVTKVRFYRVSWEIRKADLAIRKRHGDLRDPLGAPLRRFPPKREDSKVRLPPFGKIFA